jgi:sugar phosphate isomerase/epimerase
MHPRVCLHQVGFLSEPTEAFIAFCGEIGVGHVTLAFMPGSGPEVYESAKAALTGSGVRATNIAHPFARYPDIEHDTGEAAERLNAAIAAAAMLGTPNIYIVSGGRGSLDWEAAAQRMAALITPCRESALAHGVALTVETANLLNADIHIAHTIDDTIRLAEIASIGVCIDLGACWFEGDLQAKFARAMPMTGLVQLSDYVLGDRSTPCRAVPGDGVVPLEQQIGWLLEAGYKGVFDIELTGPRIVAEGHRPAFRRAAENLSEILTRLGT